MKRKETHCKRAIPGVERVAARSREGQSSRTEIHWKSILEATTDLYGTWKVSTGPIQFNYRSLKVLGYSDADSPSLRPLLQSMNHTDDRASFETQLDAHIKGKTPLLNCEFRLRTSTGGYRWFQMLGKVIRRDRRGAATEIAYTLRDIHAMKEQHEQLVAEREELMAIIQASNDCISVVDPVEFRLVAFNKAFENLILKAHGVRVTRGMRVEDVGRQKADIWNAFYRQVLARGKVSRDYLVPGLNETHHLFGQCLLRDRHIFGISVFGHDITDRKRAEQALRKSEEKFSKAFREAPLALALTSLRDQRYIDVNDAFCEATGYGREELIGRTPEDIRLWVEPEKRAEMVQQLQLSGEVRNVELLYRTKAGDIHSGIGSVAQIEIEDEPCMLAVVMDVTERKRAVEALRESEERLRIAIEAGQMYAFEWDVATDVVKRSKQSISMLDLPNGGSKHTKRELIDRLLPEDREQYTRVLASVTPERPDYKSLFRLPQRDGRMIWLEESGRATFDPNGSLKKVIGITSDVTEVRESERALRELSGRLITSQEEERRRIARELHDHIGQEADLICVQAHRLDSGVADDEQTTRSDIHELYRRVKVLTGDISKLSHRLHSSELTFLGLAVAAERLCRDLSHEYGIDVDYQPKALPANLDSAKSLCLYRVLQEALQNAVKHSHATQVAVELRAVENTIDLKVRDNGQGFDVEKTGSGLGLLSMRERLNSVGGKLAISSRPGSGTKVTAHVPI